MKYVFNKNVTHRGVRYAAGDEIKKGDEGFDILVGSGHLDKVEGHKEVEPKAEIESVPVEEPAQPKKSAHKPKK